MYFVQIRRNAAGEPDTSVYRIIGSPLLIDIVDPLPAPTFVSGRAVVNARLRDGNGIPQYFLNAMSAASANDVSGNRVSEDLAITVLASRSSGTQRQGPVTFIEDVGRPHSTGTNLKQHGDHDTRPGYF